MATDKKGVSMGPFDFGGFGGPAFNDNFGPTSIGPTGSNFGDVTIGGALDKKSMIIVGVFAVAALYIWRR